MRQPDTFKRRLLAREPQFGAFVGMADPIAAEICAVAGFDWLLIDTEHGPNDLRTVLHQLHAVEAHGVSCLVRPSSADPVTIGRLLDIGARSLLVPMIGSAAEAAALVEATRYPPDGRRGVGSALSRASGWNTDTTYLSRASEGLCIIAQVEDERGLDAVGAIAETPGIDAVFIGPSDLAASLGHLGDPQHPRVRAAVEEAIGTVKGRGLPVGVFAPTEDAARRYAGDGVDLIACGTDTTMLVQAGQERLRRVRGS